MTKRIKLMLAGIAAIAVASPAAATWKGGGHLYDTLSDCFKENYSCKFVGRLVQVDNVAGLARANALLRSSRRAGSAETLYYAVDRGPMRGQPVGRRGGLPATAVDLLVAGCLTAGGDVHKTPCSGKEVKILVEE